MCFFTRKTGNKESLSLSCSRQETQLTRDHPEPALSQSRLQFSEFNLTACLEHFLSNHYPSFSPSKRAIIFLPGVQCKECYCTGGVTRLLGCQALPPKALEVLRLFPQTRVNLFPDSDLKAVKLPRLCMCVFPFLSCVRGLFLHGCEVWGVFTSAFVRFSTRAASKPTDGLVLCPVPGVTSTQSCGHVPAQPWVCLGWFCRCAEDVQLCGCALAVPAALRGSGTSLLAGEHLLFQAGSGRDSQDTFYSLCALCIGISAADIKKSNNKGKKYSHCFLLFSIMCLCEARAGRGRRGSGSASAARLGDVFPAPGTTGGCRLWLRAGRE